MADPNALRKNFFCSLCRTRFASRPSVRDHIDDVHPDKRVFILKQVETINPITTLPGEYYDDTNDELSDWAGNRADDAGRLAREVLELRRELAEAREILACALDDHDNANGRLLDGNDPHWSNDARRALALPAQAAQKEDAQQ